MRAARWNWRTAFFAQARADYDLFRRLSKQPDVPLCHTLHFLQMATEKLGKGFATDRKGEQRPLRTHAAFVSMIRLFERDRQVQWLLGRNAAQRKAFVQSILEVAEAVESLAPVGDIDRPTPEYPWENEGVIYVPRDYAFDKMGADKKVNLRPDNSRMIKLLGFIEACFELVEE